MFKALQVKVYKVYPFGIFFELPGHDFIDMKNLMMIFMAFFSTRQSTSARVMVTSDDNYDEVDTAQADILAIRQQQKLAADILVARQGGGDIKELYTNYRDSESQDSGKTGSLDEGNFVYADIFLFFQGEFQNMME